MLPPLRNRVEDIPLLADHFIAKLRKRTNSEVGEVAAAAMDRLTGYAWPGNVRELENVIERALLLADGPTIDAGDLPAMHAGDLVPRTHDLPEGGKNLNEVVEGIEERLLRQALEQAGGVKAEAARLLGLKSSAFYYKLEKYGIEA